MKIVGLLNDEDELNEMENIAKIFIVEQRMKNLPYIKIVKTSIYGMQGVQAGKKYIQC